MKFASGDNRQPIVALAHFALLNATQISLFRREDSRTPFEKANDLAFENGAGELGDSRVSRISN